MKHQPVFLLLLVGAILAVHLVSSVPNQQHQNNRLKSQKQDRVHHAKPYSAAAASSRQHHESSEHQVHPKKQVKQPRQHHHEPSKVREHVIKPRIHESPAVHHAPSKHHTDTGKRHLEIQKPPKPFLQPPLTLPKHQHPAKHHGKQERNNKHR